MKLHGAGWFASGVALTLLWSAWIMMPGDATRESLAAAEERGDRATAARLLAARGEARATAAVEFVGGAVAAAVGVAAFAAARSLSGTRPARRAGA